MNILLLLICICAKNLENTQYPSCQNSKPYRTIRVIQEKDEYRTTNIMCPFALYSVEKN